MRTALRPMSKAAVRAADAQTAKKYSSKPKPGDRRYSSFEKEWMDAYIAAGGKYTEDKSQTPAKKTTKAKAKSKKAMSQTSPGQVQKPCQGRGRGASPKKSKPRQKNCDCVIEELRVSCGHAGRTAKDGVLMVVPDAAASADEITVETKTKGGCGGKVEIAISGENGFPKKSAAKQTFSARTPASGVTPTSWLPFLKTTPQKRRVSAAACGGSADPVDILVYPNDKLSIKLDFEDWREKYEGVLSLLPIDLGSKREAPGLSKKFLDDVEKKGPAGYIAVEGRWQEDGDSHRANCEIDANGGMDPLIGFSAAFLIAGVPIPPKIDQYVRGGVCLSIAGGFGVSVHLKFVYWPDTNGYEYSSTDLEIEGKVGVEVAAEMFVLSEDIAGAKAGGKSSLSGKLVGEFSSDPKAYLQGVFSPLTATVAFKTLWGLIEYEREWPIIESIESELFEVL